MKKILTALALMATAMVCLSSCNKNNVPDMSQNLFLPGSVWVDDAGAASFVQKSMYLKKY